MVGRLSISTKKLKNDTLEKLVQEITEVYGEDVAKVCLKYIFDPATYDGDEMLYQLRKTFNNEDNNATDS